MFNYFIKQKMSDHFPKIFVLILSLAYPIKSKEFLDLQIIKQKSIFFIFKHCIPYYSHAAFDCHGT